MTEINNNYQPVNTPGVENPLVATTPPANVVRTPDAAPAPVDAQTKLEQDIGAKGADPSAEAPGTQEKPKFTTPQAPNADKPSQLDKIQDEQAAKDQEAVAEEAKGDAKVAGGLQAAGGTMAAVGGICAAVGGPIGMIVGAVIAALGAILGLVGMIMGNSAQEKAQIMANEESKKVAKQKEIASHEAPKVDMELINKQPSKGGNALKLGADEAMAEAEKVAPKREVKEGSDRPSLAAQATLDASESHTV